MRKVRELHHSPHIFGLLPGSRKSNVLAWTMPAILQRLKQVLLKWSVYMGKGWFGGAMMPLMFVISQSLCVCVILLALLRYDSTDVCLARVLPKWGVYMGNGWIVP